MTFDVGNNVENITRIYDDIFDVIVNIWNTCRPVYILL